LPLPLLAAVVSRSFRGKALTIMCKVSAEHIGLLRTFGTLFFIGGIVSAFSGVTYFRRIIRKIEEPFTFWANVVGLLLMGSGVLLATWVCA
jgi:hypothetical protein